VSERAEGYALVGLTVVLFIVFSVLPASSDTFPTSANLRIMLADQAVLLVISLAVLVPIVTKSWDFTPGATMGLASIFAASTVSSSGSIPLCILAALGVGLAVGAFNGVLVTMARINSVIATLGMTIVIAGIVQWKTDGLSILEGIPSSLTDFGSNTALGIPLLAWVALGLTALTYYLVAHTVYGRNLYAVGSNRAAARLVGLRNERFVFSTYVISGALAGAAGVLQLARSGTGNPEAGPGFILPAYAAVFLGATAISPGRWNVWGVVVAIVFLGVLNSGLTLAGASGYVNSLVNGAALFAGVGVANLLARRRGRPLEMA
jgi:ribose transport system permease protein